MSSSPDSYDQIAYPSYPYCQTHPDRLATIATLFGMKPTDVEHCRVLELGCAGGGNLLPMAEQLPGSTFVGVDHSSKQIEQAQRVKTSLGMKNIDFRTCDLRDIDGEFGEFDYVICHGLYCWVPHETKQKIIDICRRNLAPAGVAYISYNTLPGWHFRGMIRDMMLYHVSQFNETETRLAQSRSLIEFMADAAPKLSTTYGTILKHELEVVRKKRDEHLLHDHLEEINEPLYFHQFIETCQFAELQYLGEANFHSMWTGDLPPEVAETINKMSANLIRREQYLDFLRNRMFRETLICHADVKLSRTLTADSLKHLYVASRLAPDIVNPDLSPGVPVGFSHPKGNRITVAGVFTKSALCLLHDRWPQSLPFATLLQSAGEKIGHVTPNPSDAQVLAKDLIDCYGNQLIDLRSHEDPFTMAPGDRSTASALARYTAASENVVPNLAHQMVPLTDIERAVLLMLDGSRDRTAVVSEINHAIERNELSGEIDWKSASGPLNSTQVLESVVGKTIQGLAQKALLHASPA